MTMQHKGRKLVAAFFLVVAFGLLQYFASLPKAPAIAPETIQVRPPFPVDFTLPDLQGNPVRLSDQRGKVVLINLWATWCYPCREEMPSMHALYRDYRDKGFEILAISIDIQGQGVIAPFVDEYGLTFPILLDPTNVMSTRLQAPGIPTSYLLDKQGRIVSVEIGAKDWNSHTMRRLIERLLAEDGRRTTS